MRAIEHALNARREYLTNDGQIMQGGQELETMLKANKDEQNQAYKLERDVVVCHFSSPHALLASPTREAQISFSCGLEKAAFSAWSSTRSVERDKLTAAQTCLVGTIPWNFGRSIRIST